MTLKEFQRKYGVPYNVGYYATYKVKSTSDPADMRDREYPEKELLEEAILQAESKVHKYRQLYNQQVDILDKLKRNF